MRKVETLDDLRAEQKRLRFHQLYLEAEIKKDIAGIKASLAPLALVTTGAKKALSSDSNAIVGSSAGKLAGYLAKNLLLKNSGLITRLLVPFLVKNVTSNVIEDNKTKIVDWVGSLVSRFKSRKTTVADPPAL